MMESWTTFSVRLLDSLLGWTLDWPRDVGLVLIAILTTVFLLIFRQCATNQERLRQVQADLARLRTLRREALQNADLEALTRARRVRRAVLGTKLRAELPAVLLSLAPCAALLTWGEQRLAFLPPTRDVTIRLLLPRSAAGQILHLVPEEGLHCSTGWIKRLELTDEEHPQATASWDLKADDFVTGCGLTICHGDQRVVHPILFHSTRYAPPRVEHPQWGTTEAILNEYRPFRIVPSWFGLPAWLVGLLPMTLAMYVIARRASGIL